MPKIRVTIVTSLAVLFSASTVLATLVTPESVFRKVDGFGVGNCVFSSTPMPFMKESTYDVKTEFNSSDKPVEIRCYFGQKVGEHTAKGAFYNSLRDENEYFNYLTIEEPDGGDTFYERLGVYHPSGKSIDWDQMRMGIQPNGPINCNWDADDKLGTDGCMDIDKQVTALAAKKGASLPYTAEVCISMYYKWTNDYEEVWDDFRNSWKRQRTRVSPQYMAGPNCINYTVEGSGPAVSPVAENAATEDKKKKEKKGPFKGLKFPF